MVPKFHFTQSTSFLQAIKLGEKAPYESITPNLNDVAVLQYTGGTTGVAKGAMLSHGNILANMLQAQPMFDTYGLSDDGDCLIQPLPLYHIYAFTVGLILLSKGAHCVLIPNPRDLPAMVKELKNWTINGFCGLNTLFIALCNNPAFKQLDFSQLKLTLSGGMALTSYAASLWKDTTGQDIYEGYGLTETSPVVSVNSGNGMRQGTIGVALPLTQIDIRDDEHNSLPLGESGELCVKGPQVMQGYWLRKEATESAIIDGWFYTGDIAILDQDGYLTIVDRKKDMILTSGFNVYPNEVEDAICQHESILEACAIGVPDQKSGEVVHVYAVKTSSQASVNEKDVIHFSREYLAGYKVPKRIIFKDELPKTNVGKILRREVRDMALKQLG
jgi:long-chain acyl-CoA synthetase